MEETKTFLQRCLEGTAQPSEIHDAVEVYHAGDGNGTLREYLGFDPYEYEAWGREGDETVTEIATIFDQEMENRNYHRFTNLFSSIRSGIWAILPGIPDSRISHALCKIFNKLFSEEEEIIGC